LAFQLLIELGDRQGDTAQERIWCNENLHRIGLFYHLLDYKPIFWYYMRAILTI
jgi:hypothetical protein